MRLLLQMSALLSQSILAVVRLRFSPRAVLEHTFLAGVRSLLFVSVTLAFVGMIGVYQTASQMAEILPEYSVLGAGAIQMAVREMGPIITGLLLGIRVGTGYAAELGTMKVTDQLDALTLSSVNPVEYLVVPRILASILASVALCTLGTMVGIGAGMVVAYTGFSVLPDTFLSLRFVRMFDLTMGLTKCLAFGLAVPLISCASGLDASGGSEGVGRATTRSVVASSLVVILLDALISVLWEVTL